MTPEEFIKKCIFEPEDTERYAKMKANMLEDLEALRKPVVSGSLPSVDEASAMAVKVAEKIKSEINAQEQAMFIAGFGECVKWLSGNDR